MKGSNIYNDGQVNAVGTDIPGKYYIYDQIKPIFEIIALRILNALLLFLLEFFSAEVNFLLEGIFANRQIIIYYN